MIVLISGPPCAGKTHHARTHAGPNDLVLDQDYLGRVAFEKAVNELQDARAPRAWVIRCLPDPAARAAYRERISATEHVHLHPPTPVLIERAQSRPMPHRHVAAIRSYLAKEEGRAPLPGPRDPVPTIRAWWS